MVIDKKYKLKKYTFSNQKSTKWNEMECVLHNF